MAMPSGNVTSSGRRSAVAGSSASRARGSSSADGDGNAEGLARALGWFSIGLGVAEVVAPRRLSRVIGCPPSRPALVRGLGLREIASGLGILAARRRPTPWVWTRVAGDAIDLALLGVAFGSSRTEKRRVALAAAAVAGVTALDVRCGTQLREATHATGGIEFRKSITINASQEEVYAFWRNFQNFPLFMRHLESVRVTSDRESHWVAKGPADMRVEWRAEVVTDVPNEAIAWRSIDSADVEHHGSVRFERALNGRGTIVRVEMSYMPPGGKLGNAIATLFGKDPYQQLSEGLRRFKQLVETGEVPTTEGQPAGPAHSLFTRRTRNAS